MVDTRDLGGKARRKRAGASTKPTPRLVVLFGGRLVQAGRLVVAPRRGEEWMWEREREGGRAWLEGEKEARVTTHAEGEGSERGERERETERETEREREREGKRGE